MVTILAASTPLTVASAASNSDRSDAGPPAFHQAMFSSSYGLGTPAIFTRSSVYPKWGSKGRRYGYRGGGLQCVPFARDASGIALTGNAWTWWDQAAGIYERGSTPEPGSILAFRANGTMRLGHVAVVSRVVNDREIEIDHANWGYRGAVSRSVPVVDVSPSNDWTEVRVSLGDGDAFGSIYPTHGFIYGRPDRGTVVAGRASVPAAAPALSVAPHDVGPAAEQADGGYEEVAEAPAPHRHRKNRQHAR
jgi:hypothetical protein